MSNIAKGFERGSISEFHQFIVIAKGSCAELRSQLYVTLDAGYITQAVFDRIYSQALEVSKSFGGIKSTLKNRKEGPHLLIAHCFRLIAFYSLLIAFYSLLTSPRYSFFVPSVV
jgi:hypothetical protein